MVWTFIILLVIADVILFGMLFVTTNHVDARVARNEEYLKVVSEDLKQIKFLLKHEVAMANSEIYPVTKESHIDYVTFDESGQS